MSQPGRNTPLVSHDYALSPRLSQPCNAREASLPPSLRLWLPSKQRLWRHEIASRRFGSVQTCSSDSLLVAHTICAIRHHSPCTIGTRRASKEGDASECCSLLAVVVLLGRPGQVSGYSSNSHLACAGVPTRCPIKSARGLTILGIAHDLTSGTQSALLR